MRRRCVCVNVTCARCKALLLRARRCCLGGPIRDVALPSSPVTEAQGRNVAGDDDAICCRRKACRHEHVSHQGPEPRQLPLMLRALLLLWRQMMLMNLPVALAVANEADADDDADLENVDAHRCSQR